MDKENQKIFYRLRSIEHKIDILIESNKSTDIKCAKMIKHVIFVESIWTRIRRPFFFLFEKVNCLRLGYTKKQLLP